MKQILLLISIVLLLGCSKENGGSNRDYWTVKYEVSSSLNYVDGVVVYTNEAGVVVTAGTANSPADFPWSYEARFSKDPGIPNRLLRIMLVELTTGSNYNFDFNEYLNSTLSIKISVDGKEVNKLYGTLTELRNSSLFVVYELK